MIRVIVGFALVLWFVVRASASEEVFPSGESIISSGAEYSSGTELKLGEGTKVKLQDGGSILYDGSENAADSQAMTIGPGAELQLDGGNITFTNFAGKIILEGSEQSPARLSASSGVFTVHSRYEGKGNDNIGRLYVKDYSELIFDGTSELRYLYATRAENVSEKAPAFKHEGGTVIFRGNSRFYTEATSAQVVFSTGYTEFSGASRLVFDNKLKNEFGVMFGTETTGGTNGTLVVFKDHAGTEQHNFAYPTSFYLTNHRRGTWTTMRFDSDSSISLGGITYIGCSAVNASWKGGAEFIITDGYAQSGGQWGLHVGYVKNNPAESFACTGRVCVAGGTLVSRSTKGGQNSSDREFVGTIVGFGPAFANPVPLADASLEVSDGVFTNWFGYFAVGTGRSVGRVKQTGGRIVSTPSYDRPMVIGHAGGKGSFVVSNGVSTASSSAYVGGALSEDLNVDNYRTQNDAAAEGEDFSIGGAAGELVVAAEDATKPCSFTLTARNGGGAGALHVGRNGNGLVEVGAGGSLTVESAVLHGTAATLVRTVEDSDAGEFAVNGDFTVEAGAKLVVKVKGRMSRPWTRLVLCDSRTGDFAAEDISVESEDVLCRVVQNREGDSSGSIWLHRPFGFRMVVR